MIEERSRDIAAADGYALAARTFEPAGRPRAHVLVAPAMGVPQRYYTAFARWLAARDVQATTFDYRGLGLSRRGSLRDLEADIFTWARVDAAAVLADVTAVAGDRPLYWVGHSLGGQIFAMVPGTARVTRMVTVASGSGYWRENSPTLRWRAPFLWHVLVPIAMGVAGYFPGARLRTIGDLPRGVMRQWRRWCLHPEYAVGVEGEGLRSEFAAVRTPITSLSFTDDEYMSAANIASLHGFYSGAPREMVRVAPADVGERRIGHFGFFRERYARNLWETHMWPALH